MKNLARLSHSNRNTMKFLKTIFLGVVLCISFFMGGMLYMAIVAPTPPVCVSGKQQNDLLYALPEKNPLETSYIYMPGRGMHGNLMFEYAAGYCTAKKLDRTFVVSPRFKLLLGNTFHVTAPEPEEFDDMNITDFSVFSQKPRCCKYDERVVKLPRLDITLRGFFHSWLYFESCAEDIRREFTFKDPLPKRADGFLRTALKSFKWNPETVVFVGVHIRRGGMRPGLLPRTHGDAKPPPGYYGKAMGYYDKKFPRRNVMFVVASDDIRWARRYLHHPNIVISGDKAVDFHMALLSKCNHSIISIGSVSWWSAWLAGGNVVYYNGWPSPLSDVSQKYTLNQYFYPKWVGMS